MILNIYNSIFIKLANNYVFNIGNIKPYYEHKSNFKKQKVLKNLLKYYRYLGFINFNSYKNKKEYKKND